MFLIFRTDNAWPDRLQDLSVELDSGEVAHARARRLKDGDPISVGDGMGRRWMGTLGWDDRKSARVVISGLCEKSPQTLPDFALLCAVPKSSRRDWLIEKAAELGLRRFIPAEFHRSVRDRISPDRFQRLSREAAAQSENWYLPVLEEILPMDRIGQFLRSELERGCEVHILDLPENESGRRDFDSTMTGTATLPDSGTHHVAREAYSPVIIVVGPEGGFSERDRNMWRPLLENYEKCRVVALGRSVLRIETAAVAYLGFLSISRVLK